MTPPRKTEEAVAEEPLTSAPEEVAAPVKSSGDMCSNHPDRDALYRTTSTTANTLYFCEECSRRTGEGLESL